MGALGAGLFTTLYNIVPNLYLGLRAAGMYLTRDLEKEAINLPSGVFSETPISAFSSSS